MKLNFSEYYLTQLFSLVINARKLKNELTSAQTYGSFLYWKEIEKRFS